jgi:hypothetical protein
MPGELPDIAAPMRLDGARHGGRALAGADHHGAPLGWIRQPGGEAMRRIGGGDGRIEQIAQQGALVQVAHCQRPSSRSCLRCAALGLYSQPTQPA